MQLGDLRGWMAGHDAVVVGCGPSGITDATHRGHALKYEYAEHWTIGCNRAVQFCDPDFAVCIEPFRDPIWPIMREASPLAVLAHIHLDRRGKSPHPRIVKMSGKDVLRWISDKPADLPNVSGSHPLIVGQSPFFGLAFAVMMGFETIGLIGVDLTPDRYPDAKPSNNGYGKLNTIAKHMGSRIINLNPESRLRAFEFGGWEEIRTK